MRVILFRGKRVDNGEWVYGSFVMDVTELRQRKRQVSDPILANGFIRRYDFQNHKVEMFDVERETVGQFTGLTDKNGKRIFEGDILEFDDCGETGYEYKEGFYFTNRAVVAWRHSAWEFGKFMYHDSCVLEEMYSSREDFIEIFKYSEIIGNIHDNPELLKGE